MWPRVAAVLLGAAVLWPSLPHVVHVTAPEDRPVEIATLPCETNLQATSSGYLIDDQIIVTVAHAIYESRDFAVRDATGAWHEATVQHMDLERDLAVLAVGALLASPVERRPASSGEQIRMVGGAASGTAEGEVIRRVRLTTEVIGDLSATSARSGYELDVAIKPGDSGAAVVDAQDRLVGMVFARSTGRNASWATSVVEIEDALNGRSVPTWECELDSDVELVLPPLDPATEPERLAP